MATDDAAPGSPALRAVELRKTYGAVVALERLSLEVQPGEFFTLLGPSGSGKTTTLRLIAGFERPDSGWIELSGGPVTARAPYERDVNTVFQDYALFPHMTVADNVGYGLRVKGVPRAERKGRAAEALELAPLPGVSGREAAPRAGGGEAGRGRPTGWGGSRPRAGKSRSSSPAASASGSRSHARS